MATATITDTEAVDQINKILEDGFVDFMLHGFPVLGEILDDIEDVLAAVGREQGANNDGP